MTSAASKGAEQAHEAELRELLNPLPDPHLDAILALGREALRAAVLSIAVIDEARGRQLFKAQAGLARTSAQATEIPLSHSFARHVHETAADLVIPDTRLHPLVKDSPGIAIYSVAAYMGTPLIGSDGYLLGVVSAVDREPRAWTEAELGMLQMVADLARRQIRQRAALLRLANNRARLQREVILKDGAAEQWREMATQDALTGLPNRRAFTEAYAERADPGAPASLTLFALIDIDHFKRINDAYGHEVGDLVLAEIAQRFRACCRGTDLVARMGGEEFGLLAPCVNEATSLKIGYRLKRAISGTPIDAGAGRSIPVTISIGCAVFGPGDDFSTVYQRADRELYRAKLAGRNRISDGRFKRSA